MAWSTQCEDFTHTDRIALAVVAVAAAAPLQDLLRIKCTSRGECSHTKSVEMHFTPVHFTPGEQLHSQNISRSCCGCVEGGVKYLGVLGGK